MECPDCNSINIITNWFDYDIPYGLDDNQVIITVNVPARTCKDCGLEFLDGESEDLIDVAIKKYEAQFKVLEIIRDLSGIILLLTILFILWIIA